MPRLGSFWTDRLGLRLAQAEAQFALASVTSDKTKYVISQLEYRHATDVEDIITSDGRDLHQQEDRASTPPFITRNERVRQLLTHKEKGERKPSEILRHLKSLAPDVRDEFLRNISSSR